MHAQDEAPHVFAEHLQNIGTLSIQVTLSTRVGSQTTAILQECGRVVSVSHNGRKTSLRLPVYVPVDCDDFVLPVTLTDSTTLDLRLPVRRGSDGDCTKDNNVPWSASELNTETAIHCKSCHCTLVPRARISRWKNLPSEGWAEMMEFWHCHKPHDHASSNGDKLMTESRLALSAGIGMVAPMEFLFFSTDCTGIKTLDTAGATTLLECSSCQAFVGTTDNECDGVRLRKASLCISRGAQEPMTSHPLEHWLSGLLLSAIETQGVRKFFVHDASTNILTGREVWVFATDVNMSSSSSKFEQPLRAVKILHRQHIQSGTTHGMLDSKAYAEGEIELPTSELVALFAMLDDSVALLPPREQARRMGEWRIGFLRRFSTNR